MFSAGRSWSGLVPARPASRGKEGIIRRMDGDSDTIQAEWRAHDDWIYSLALSPDGATLASGDWSGSVRVHDLRSIDTHAPKAD